jgi:hypothetical protein
MIESDIYRNTAADEHHHGTHGTDIHGTHSVDTNSEAAADSAGAGNEHHHRDEEIEPKGRKETMKDRIAPTLTALALAGIIGLISAANAKAATTEADIIEGAAIRNAIERTDINLDNNIAKEDITKEININYIGRINRDDIIGDPAITGIVIENINI